MQIILIKMMKFLAKFLHRYGIIQKARMGKGYFWKFLQTDWNNENIERKIQQKYLLMKKKFNYFSSIYVSTEVHVTRRTRYVTLHQKRIILKKSRIIFKKISISICLNYILEKDTLENYYCSRSMKTITFYRYSTAFIFSPEMNFIV